MNNQTTYWQLMTALKSNGPLVTTGKTLIAVTGVELEDGSGHKFNVSGYLSTGGSKVTLFVVTTD